MKRFHPQTSAKWTVAPPRARRVYTIETFRELAAKKGGTCLSNTYRNLHTALRWKCSAGHVWSARPFSLLYNETWCPMCAVWSSGRVSADKLRAIAQWHGGKCLSLQGRATEPRLWRCSEDHLWEAKPREARDAWCPVCRDDKARILAAEHMLAERRRVCMPDPPQSDAAETLWVCPAGHTWRAAPEMTTGVACPRCEVDSQFVWQCAVGHTWRASPDNQEQGCPMCRALRVPAHELPQGRPEQTQAGC
jgi:hypothetical protein